MFKGRHNYDFIMSYNENKAIIFYTMILISKPENDKDINNEGYYTPSVKLADL